MGFIIVNYKVVHQEPMLYDRVIHLVALVTPRPQEQWSFVLISKRLQGMEWGRHRKQCGCVHWLQSVANAGDVIVFILLYSQKPLATCPNSIFYDRALQVVSYHSQPSIIASLLWPLAVLGVSYYFLPLNVSHKWHSVVSCDSRSRTQELPEHALYTKVNKNINFWR